jgi:nucleoside-diphosphate-sugar epimerase
MGKNHGLLKFGEIPMRPDQVYKLSVSTSKLQELGWRPRVNLTEGLTHTINWICQKKLAPIRLNDGTEVDLTGFVI